MKMVMSTKGSSTDICSSSSTVSGGATGSKPLAETLKQLMDLIVDVDLFEALDKDFIYGYSIKTLLNKLDVSDASIEVVYFLVAFGPLIDKIHADFPCKHDTKMKVVPKLTEISKAWNLASESD